MNLFNLQGEFSQALEVYETRKNEKTKIFEKSSKEQQIKFLFNAAYTLFGVGEYKKALKVLNDILNDNEQKLRQDLYSFARILNLLIHFELENFEFLEYSSNSAIRYLNRIKRDYEIETVFVKQMRKLARTATKLESIPIYEETLVQIEDLLKDENEHVILDYIDIQNWIKSKITDKSFVELVKAQTKA
jgi:tetratricopeptide (TPR) repeat protein